MQFVPNIQFTCLVKCEGKQREFNFLKRSSAVFPFYNVDTADLAGIRFQFNMDKATDKWIIRETDLPSWILDAETDLSLRILEQDFS